jgi:CDGSH-type Zn-finger protein
MSMRIKVTENGPYIVSGNVPLGQERVVLGSDNEPDRWEKLPDLAGGETYALCRCGRSGTKPFCDGSHVAAGFDGTETAGRDAYLVGVERTEGPALDLTYSPTYCSIARFCHSGIEAWGYTERSDDPEARQAAIGQAANCPSGSLVAWDKTPGEAIEPALAPSISVTETPRGTDGPLWVKGGVPIEAADGFVYETRNRVALCRCGRSKNKPFCDGRHRELER